MRAVVLIGYGDTDQLVLQEVARPQPAPGEVLIQVKAAGVNPIDWQIRRGARRWLPGGRPPLVLGFDVAGEVAAIGPEVVDLEPGDAVFAMLDSARSGGYAEYAVAGQSAVARMPAGLTFEEAAALPLAGLTALQALRDVAGLRAGELLAVHGAAGGVGHLAVQIGAAMGARVIAAAAPRHRDYLLRLGAERFVDLTTEDLMALPRQPGPTRHIRRAPVAPATSGLGRGTAGFAGGMTRPATAYGDNAANARSFANGANGANTGSVDEGAEAEPDEPSTEVAFDVLFDAAGVLRYVDCEPALLDGGVFVTTRQGFATWTAELRSRLSAVIDRRAPRRAAAIRVHPSGADLAALAHLVETRGLRPTVERVYPLAEAARAHQAGESGGRQGKLVLRVAADASDPNDPNDASDTTDRPR